MNHGACSLQQTDHLGQLVEALEILYEAIQSQYPLLQVHVARRAQHYRPPIFAPTIDFFPIKVISAICSTDCIG